MYQSGCAAYILYDAPIYVLALGCTFFKGIKGLEFFCAGFRFVTFTSAVDCTQNCIVSESGTEIWTKFVNTLLFNKLEMVSINLSESVIVLLSYARILCSSLQNGYIVYIEKEYDIN